MNRNVIFAGCAALLLLVSCNTKKEEKEEIGKYTVTNPVVIDTSFTKEYVAQIKSVRNIEIRTQEKGFLQNIYVDEGQFVKTGQLLFKIMPKMYEAELLKSKAEAKAAEILRLKDVATIEFGSSMYDIYSNLDGKPSAAVTIKQLYGSNASQVIKNVKLKLEQLKKESFPKGIDYKSNRTCRAKVSS